MNPSLGQPFPQRAGGGDLRVVSGIEQHPNAGKAGDFGDIKGRGADQRQHIKASAGDIAQQDRLIIILHAARHAMGQKRNWPALPQRGI
jgi:hypothetical protein